MTAARLKDVADVRVSNLDKNTVDGEVPVRLCNYTDVYYATTITGDRDFMVASATPSQVETFRLRRGQTLITKDSETADDIGVPAFVDVEADDLVCGYHLAQITPRAGAVDPKFLFWTMSSALTRDQLGVGASGVTRFGLRTETITGLPVRLPPLDVQRRIAAFLDAETARIDELVTLKAQMGGLLAERRASRTEELLRPSDERAIRIGYLLSEVDERLGSVPGNDEAPDLLAVSIHHGVVPRSALTDDPPRADDLGAYKVVQADDLVINRLRAFQGGVGRAPQAGIVSPDYLVLRPAYGVLAGYMHYLMRSPWFVGQMTRVLRGIGDPGQGNVRTPRVNWSDLRLVEVPDRPSDVQRTILDVLRCEDAATRELESTLERQVQLLRERRQSLITAAVTGELEEA